MNDSLQSLPSLYRLPSTARCFFWAAIPAIASLASSAIGAAGSMGAFGGGGGAGGSYEEAGQQRQQAALQAAQAKWNALQVASDYLERYREWGKTAGGAITDLWNLPGSSGRDPSETLAATPGYQFMEGRMSDAVTRGALAGGLGGSGYGLSRLANTIGGLAQTYALTPYREDLSKLYAGGLGAATQTGQWNIGTAAGAGQDYMSAAGANTEAQIQALNAANASQSSSNQGIFGSLGLGIGALGDLGKILGQGNTTSSPWYGSGQGWTGSGWGYGGVHGGGASASGNMLPSMARGGALPANQFAIVGERGPEIVRFARDGYVIPNHMIPRYALAA